MPRAAVAAVLATLAAGVACSGGTAAGGSVAAGPPAAPDVLTQRHAGRTFTLRLGREVALRLPPATERTPRASSRAVSLAPVEYFADPGYREWLVTAERPGRTTLTAVVGARTLRLTLVVRR
jgi:hypothetical protein